MLNSSTGNQREGTYRTWEEEETNWKANHVCVRSFLNSNEHRSREKVCDTWHETGSCGSYIFQFLLPKQDLSNKAFVLPAL